ncbi:hypothetical protein [Serratia fonticola]|jgi:hypothetical protein|uniref:hypothetical protein n=1 Tax=Serratia fonticola TaxID=47917 RepID=UPI0015769043|nr:hypothetical protein [Serratia fonticola]NTY89772.1 hypothetical protein [Serratia fonticola]NTZ15568.1 hypothetical protein [Serratia fonticola]CAI1542675.1 Uncharacterised protein [Serratia fonticola]CAI1656271.1 Uncharacterised protein [Serratia fonticola]CAI1869794.1 Uncharacterised protein [Serratia fonticola]
MKSKFLARSAVLLLASVWGFSAQAASRDYVVSYPSSSLISETLLEMTPSVNNERNDLMMKLVCDLARNEKSQAEVDTYLQRNGVDVSQIPASGNALSLLVNGETQKQKAACASYIATSVILPGDNKDLYQGVNVANKDKTLSVKQEVDQDKLNQVMRTRMAIAEANAEFYSLMGNALADKGNMSYAAYKNQIFDMFTELAPFYLDRVKQLYGGKKGDITVLSLSNSDYRVMDDKGYVMSFSQGAFELEVKGITWFGNGKLLGKDYYLDVPYFSRAATNAEPKGKASKKRK